MAFVIYCDFSILGAELLAVILGALKHIGLPLSRSGSDVEHRVIPTAHCHLQARQSVTWIIEQEIPWRNGVSLVSTSPMSKLRRLKLHRRQQKDQVTEQWIQASEGKTVHWLLGHDVVCKLK